MFCSHPRALRLEKGKYFNARHGEDAFEVKVNFVASKGKGKRRSGYWFWKSASVKWGKFAIIFNSYILQLRALKSRHLLGAVQFKFQIWKNLRTLPRTTWVTINPLSLSKVKTPTTLLWVSWTSLSVSTILTAIPPLTDLSHSFTIKCLLRMLSKGPNQDRSSHILESRCPQ